MGELTIADSSCIVVSEVALGQDWGREWALEHV